MGWWRWVRLTLRLVGLLMRVVLTRDNLEGVILSAWRFTIRRLLVALTLCLALLCPFALPVHAQQQAAVHYDQQIQTVYVTRTGKKYHRDGCRHLNASKIRISLKHAKAKGYTACKVCHPPQ